MILNNLIPKINAPTLLFVMKINLVFRGRFIRLNTVLGHLQIKLGTQYVFHADRIAFRIGYSNDIISISCGKCMVFFAI